MKKINRLIRVLVVVVVAYHATCCQSREKLQTSPIHLNQIGFYPQAQKIAIIEQSKAASFQLRSTSNQAVVFSGKTTQPCVSTFSGKTLWVADFSSFKTPGSFFVAVDGAGQSAPFQIQDHVFEQASKAVIRGYYFQRASAALPKQFAGVWQRPAGHPDDKVYVHGSAANAQRPEGTIISSRRGWYDAGDYNKYIVNSGITMGTLLSAYEDYPEYYKHLKLDIPESSNNLPDLLDEVIWNLRWMLTMQDPADGGVYHKLTNAKFDKMIMPADADTKRYVVAKGTAATLDFAAVMAQAARVFRPFESSTPGLADSCLAASEYAWRWAKTNPAIVYDQRAINSLFEPDISTGEYGDRDFEDELLWAACELMVATGKEEYRAYIKIPEKITVPNWSNVNALGLYTLMRIKLPTNQIFEELAKQCVLNLATELSRDLNERSYKTVMGSEKKDFIWGSSAVAANQSVVLVNAFRATQDKQFLLNALTNLDYLFGRNATGYCFVTGLGSKPPMHIHHRLSEADGIVPPVPGLLAGGPNPGRQDGCNYPSTVVDEAYVDDVCSYASNEIAINWNAPLVYLIGVTEATQSQKN